MVCLLAVTVAGAVAVVMAVPSVFGFSRNHCAREAA
jgi:hypothetical protein